MATTNTKISKIDWLTGNRVVQHIRETVHTHLFGGKTTDTHTRTSNTNLYTGAHGVTNVSTREYSPRKEGSRS